MTLVKKQKPKVHHTAYPADPTRNFTEWMRHIHQKVEEAQKAGNHLHNPRKN